MKQFKRAICLLCVIMLQGVVNADFVLTGFGPQSGGPVQANAGIRSIYLGRFFQTGGATDAVQRITSFVSLSSAPGSLASPHVNLWAGVSALGQTGNFLTAPQRVNTGLGFFTTQSGVRVVTNENFFVTPSVGSTLQGLVNGGTGVDFWLVANAVGSSFDAPSGTAGGNTNQFVVQFAGITAVPEPSSITLLCIALLAGVRVRRRGFRVTEANQ